VKKNLDEEEQSALNLIFNCSDCDESNADEKISKEFSEHSWQIAKLALEKLKDVCVDGTDSTITK